MRCNAGWWNAGPSTTPHQDGGGFVFTSVLKCGKCGCPMYGDDRTRVGSVSVPHVQQRKTATERASTKHELLDAVLGAIESRFNDPQTVERLRGILVARN